MAALLKISLLLLIALVFCSETYAQRGRGNSGRGNVGRGNGGRSMYGRGGTGGGVGGGVGGGGGRAQASLGAGRGRGRRYRSTLYNDDDVYGYEANYPGGEVLYVNYKSSEARAKRAPEFARSSPYSRGSQGFPGQDPGEMGYDAPDFGFQ